MAFNEINAIQRRAKKEPIDQIAQIVGIANSLGSIATSVKGFTGAKPTAGVSDPNVQGAPFSNTAQLSLSGGQYGLEDPMNKVAALQRRIGGPYGRR